MGPYWVMKHRESFAATTSGAAVGELYILSTSSNFYPQTAQGSMDVA